MARIHVEVQKRIIFVVVIFESELFYARRQRETQNRSAWLKPAPGVGVNHITLTLPGAVLCLRGSQLKRSIQGAIAFLGRRPR